MVGLPTRHTRKSAVLWLAGLLWLGGCSSANGGALRAPEAKTSAAVIEAQRELYTALFEDPPDYETAAERMSPTCQGKSNAAETVVAEVYAEVELAQSIDLGLESLLEAFSQVSYTIEDDMARGDDGSTWVYEEEIWLSEDC